MASTSISMKRNSEMNDEQERIIVGLCKDRIFCDFKIKVEHEEIECHRLVLVASSTYFRTVLIESEDDAREMVMEGFSVAAVKLVVDYMYGDRILISGAEQALSILDVGTRWQLEDEFMETIKDFIVSTALTPENSLFVRDRLIWQDNNQHAVALVDQFINKRFVQVTCSDSFTQANLQYVLNLLDSDYLDVREEMEVYESGLRWINADRQSREQHMCAIVNTVRLGLMELEDVASISLDLVNKYGTTLDQFIRENVTYLKNKKQGLPSDSNLKSTTKRQGQAVERTLMCLGGCDNKGDGLKSIEISVDDGKTWTSGGDMLVAKGFFSATICLGSVFIVGGETSSGIPLKCCQRYHIKSKQWYRISDLPEPRSDHDAACVVQNLYDTDGSTSNSTNRCEQGAACVVQQLYITGGSAPNITNTVLKLDVGDVDKGWTTAPSMIHQRNNHGSCILKGVLYVIGGYDDGRNLRSCEMLRPDSNRWMELASTNFYHQSPGVCTDDARSIYVAGCYSDELPQYVEVYDVTVDQWSIIYAQLVAVTSGLTFTYYKNTVYAVGGKKNRKVKSDVRALNRATKTWSQVGYLLTPRSNHSTVIF